MIIHRTTAEPDRKALHRAAKARQRETPARPIPPARVGSAWRNLILRAATWLRVHLRDPAPAPPPPTPQAKPRTAAATTTPPAKKPSAPHGAAVPNTPADAPRRTTDGHG